MEFRAEVVVEGCRLWVEEEVVVPLVGLGGGSLKSGHGLGPSDGTVGIERGGRTVGGGVPYWRSEIQGCPLGDRYGPSLPVVVMGVSTRCA